MPDENLEQLIKYTDEFRRAKTLALWWSSLAILAAVGLPRGESDSPAVYPLGLTFEKPLLVFAIYVSAAFTFVGVFRAWRTVVKLNSRHSADHKIGNIYELVNSLEALASDAVSGLKSAASAGDEVIPYLRALNDRVTAYASDSGAILHNQMFKNIQ